jgi:hypothetical protein
MMVSQEAALHSPEGLPAPRWDARRQNGACEVISGGLSREDPSSAKPAHGRRIDPSPLIRSGVAPLPRAWGQGSSQDTTCLRVLQQSQGQVFR